VTSNVDSHSAHSPWRPLIELSQYDLSPTLRATERIALGELTYRHHDRTRKRRVFTGVLGADLQRLLSPIDHVCSVTDFGSRYGRYNVAPYLLSGTHQFQSPYFAWTNEQWLAAIHESPKSYGPALRAVAYLIGKTYDLHATSEYSHRRNFAHIVFGRDAAEESIRRIENEMVKCGYGRKGVILPAITALCDVMLRCGSPMLEDVTPDAIAALYDSSIPKSIRYGTRQLVRVLLAMDILRTSPIAVAIVGRPRETTPLNLRSPAVPDEWASWCQRWLNTSTLTRASREAYYYELLKVGRWLAVHHPEVTNPGHWTREIAIEWVAVVTRMRVGDWSHAPKTELHKQRLGTPLSARTKAGHTCTLRTFFRDCQEWEWIPTRFDPTRALATPRGTYALIGPNPRVIADDIWAKLLWAGLNLTADDLPSSPVTGRGVYPLELVRAVTLQWLFTGLRRNEIARLPVGCIRWQHEGGGAAATEPGDNDAVCLLDVPVNKTGTAFTKPIDRSVGAAVSAWEKVRPPQPRMLDEKTGEMVDYLFAWRSRRISISFINHTVIGALCRKANVPTTDARGAITSHRARSTIATQLYNAKDPMTLFELQAWLGHRSPSSTQHYAKITPTTLTKAYTDAGYFARNIRAIEVLIDRDAVQSDAAASGTPWQHYDLGHDPCPCESGTSATRCGTYRSCCSSQQPSNRSIATSA
jgi:integrase